MTKPDDQTNDLTVVEQRDVTFYNDELTAVRADDGQVYVSVRQMCNALGVDRQAQVRRIQRHTILNDGYRGGAIMAPPGPGGGRQRAGLLRVDLVPLWLSGIRANRVKDEIRPKLERYQREAAKVLWEAFQEGRLTSDPGFRELLEADTPVVQAYKTFQALTKLAQGQILLEARVDSVEGRLEAIETTLGDPGRHVTPAQATEISQAVKAIAMALSKQSRRNEYGGVYGEMYRRYEIPSYKQLPTAKFDDCMDWLNEWLQDVAGTTPF